MIKKILALSFLIPGGLALGLDLCGGTLPITASERRSLLHSSVFEAKYYAESASLPPAQSADPDAVAGHWLNQGLPRGLRGSAHFSVDEYLQAYPSLLASETDVCHRRVRAAIHFATVGRVRGWSGLYQVGAQSWISTLTNIEQRFSPAWAEKIDAIDRFEVLPDAVGPNRIRLAILKPRLGDRPVEEFDSIGSLSQRIASVQGGAGGVRLKLKFRAAGYRVRKEDGNCKDNNSYTAHLCLSRLKDVEIDGGGNRLTFDDEFTQGILIEDSQRLTVKNVTLDWDYKNSYRAKLVAGSVRYPDSEGNWVILNDAKLIQLDSSEATDPIAGTEFDAVAPYQFSSLSWYVGKRSVPRVNFGPSGFGVPFPFVVKAGQAFVEGEGRLFFSEAVQRTPDLRLGDDVIVLRNRVAMSASGTRSRAQTVFIRKRSTRDISFDSVSIRSSPQSAFVMLGVGRGFHFKDIKIRRGGDSPNWVSTRGGGIVVFGSEGDILIEGGQNPVACANPPCIDYSASNYSELTQLGDDAINIVPFALSPTSVKKGDLPDSLEVEFVEGGLPPVAYINTRFRLTQLVPGDRLAFIVRRQLPVGFATVDRVTLQGGTPFRAIVRFKDLSSPDLKDALTRKSPAPMLALDLAAMSSRFLIRQVSFGSNSARGVAAQSPNGVVEANSIQRTAMSGVHVGYHHSAFAEGPGSNVLVQNNWIENTTHRGIPNRYEAGAISIFSEGLNGEAVRNAEPDPHGGVDAYGFFPLVQQVRVRNNRILGGQGPGISVLSAYQIFLENNQIENVDELQPFGNSGRPAYLNPLGAIYFGWARGGEIRGNRCRQSEGACGGQFGINLNPENTYDIGVQQSLPLP